LSSRFTALVLYDVEKSYVNAGMPECRRKVSPIGIFTGSKILRSGIGIPASGSVRYRWSRISPALPCQAMHISPSWSVNFIKGELNLSDFQLKDSQHFKNHQHAYRKYLFNPKGLQTQKFLSNILKALTNQSFIIIKLRSLTLTTVYVLVSNLDEI
jgi:hypothetical protein